MGRQGWGAADRHWNPRRHSATPTAARGHPSILCVGTLKQWVLVNSSLVRSVLDGSRREGPDATPRCGILRWRLRSPRRRSRASGSREGFPSPLTSSPAPCPSDWDATVVSDTTDSGTRAPSSGPDGPRPCTLNSPPPTSLATLFPGPLVVL